MMVLHRLHPLPASVLGLLAAFCALGSAGCDRASRMNAKCMAGEVMTCTELGDMYVNGTGVKRDLARAAAAYERACAGNMADACNTVGEIYEKTGIVEGGSARIQTFYAKACDGGSSAGCLNLGLLFAARDELTQAFALFERSCRGGWPAGCHQLAQSYEQGEGAARDVAKALEVYGQACDLEWVDSCLACGNLYAAGEAVTRDVATALKFYGKALQIYQVGCTAGTDADCTERDRIRTRMAVLSAGQPLQAAAPPAVKR